MKSFTALFLFPYWELKTCIMRKVVLIAMGVLFFNIFYAQDHFLVELENRSPDVQAQVKAYEGFPTIPFLANDIDEVEHSYESIKGKTSFLWFWNTKCPKCVEYISALNAMYDNHESTLNILSFCDEPKAEVLKFRETTPINFPVIANSKLLADGPFGGDFGYPRLFIIDEYGVVKYVIPEIEMRGDFDALGFFEAVHRSLAK